MYQLAIGSRIRKSPFFAATVRHGATHFSTYNHMYLAMSYGDPEAEYQRLLNGVSLWDVACERQVELRGPDAAALAQYLCPRDLSACVAGQGLYVPICDHSGRLLNDPVLLKIDDDRFWLSIADGDLLLWCRAVCAEKHFAATVCEPDVSPLAIQGPKAESVVADLFGDWVRQLKYFWFRQTDLDGIPLVVARSGWSKQGGFELYLLDGTCGLDLWDRVWAAGQPYGIGAGAPNVTERIESALLSYGTDTDDECNPLELGLEQYVHLNIAADFIGKAALQKIAAEGPRRKLTGLIFASDHRIDPIEHKCPVSQSGRNIGFVSATTHSPRLHKEIGIALLESTVVASGTDVIAHLPTGDYPARITALPFC